MRSIAALFLVLCFARGFAADERVTGLPPLKVRLSGGTVVDAVLMRGTGDASIAPDGRAVIPVQNYLTFTENGRQRRVPLTADDAAELTQAVRHYADPANRYSVLRHTEGYSEGTPEYVQLELTGAYGITRYADRSEARQQRLPTDAREGNPLFLQVNYRFRDADREKSLEPGRVGRTDPRGRILLNTEGRVDYVNYSKLIPVLERVDGRPAMAGEFPSVEEALRAARGPNPDVSRLRYAAEFGPQYSGNATEGTPRGNRLMPVIPIGTVTVRGERFVAALPPDLLQAYRRGEVKPENLLLLPPTVLRYVPNTSDWNGVVEDYFALRGTGRDITRIFVANRRQASGQNTMEMSLNSMTIIPGRDIDQSLRDLRSQAPDSILGLEFPTRPPRPSSGGGPCPFDQF